MGRLDVCVLTAAWDAYALSDILWFLYLVTATWLRCELMPQSSHPAWMSEWTHGLPEQKRSHLYISSLIDIITSCQRSVEGINSFNKSLMLETLLLSYSGS
jgi:hypothetical protein